MVTVQPLPTQYRPLAALKQDKRSLVIKYDMIYCIELTSTKPGEWLKPKTVLEEATVHYSAQTGPGSPCELLLRSSLGHLLISRCSPVVAAGGWLRAANDQQR